MSKIKVNIPIIESDKIENNKRVVEFGEKEMTLDMSLMSQIRWEQKFPEMAKKEDLEMYTERISKIESTSSSVIISKLKTLYCYFDTDMKFTEFLSLFDFTQIKYVESLANRLKEIFEIILDGASEKN